MSQHLDAAKAEAAADGSGQTGVLKHMLLSTVVSVLKESMDGVQQTADVKASILKIVGDILDGRQGKTGAMIAEVADGEVCCSVPR